MHLQTLLAAAVVGGLFFLAHRHSRSGGNLNGGGEPHMASLSQAGFMPITQLDYNSFGYASMSPSTGSALVELLGECSYTFMQTPFPEPVGSRTGSVKLDGLSSALLPGSFCLDDAVAVAMSDPCEGCSAWLTEERAPGGGVASLECVTDAPGSVMGYNVIKYSSSTVLGEMHRALVKEHPSYKALDATHGKEGAVDIMTKTRGGFSVIFNPIGDETLRLRAPAGSEAERLCGFIAREVAPRLLAVAQPQVDALLAKRE